MSDKRLDFLRKQIASLGSPAMRRAMSDALGAEAIKLVDDGFIKQRDPYGERWDRLSPATIKSRRKKGKGAKILLDTRRLANSFHARTNGAGFVVWTSTQYAPYHQHGAEMEAHSRLVSGTIAFDEKGRFMSKRKAKRKKYGSVRIATFTKQTFANGWKLPRRTMVPEEKYGGLGQIWGGALGKEAVDFIREFMSEP